MAEGVFSTAEKVSDFGNYSRTRDSIPDVGKQFRTTSRYRETVSDVGEQFLMSGNSFRYRETVSDVGNSPDSRTTSRRRKTFSDIGKRFTLSGNISIALNRSAQSKRADYTIDLVKSA